MYIRTQTGGPKCVDKKIIGTENNYNTVIESSFDIITRFEHVR